MAGSEKIIHVYDAYGFAEPMRMGILHVASSRGGEICSFEFDRLWLNAGKDRPALDPDLMPYPGRQYPSGKSGFGIFADASPDRWGRMLMNRRERIRAGKEGRKPEKLHDSDYLLGVCDETRMGGIRFKLDPDGPFLSDDKETAAPPWAALRTLEEASRNFENDETGHFGEMACTAHQARLVSRRRETKGYRDR